MLAHIYIPHGSLKVVIFVVVLGAKIFSFWLVPFFFKVSQKFAGKKRISQGVG